MIIIKNYTTSKKNTIFEPLDFWSIKIREEWTLNSGNQENKVQEIKKLLYQKDATIAKEGIAAGSVEDMNAALQEVLKTTLIHDGSYMESTKLPMP